MELTVITVMAEIFWKNNGMYQRLIFLHCHSLFPSSSAIDLFPLMMQILILGYNQEMIKVERKRPGGRVVSIPDFGS